MRSSSSSLRTPRARNSSLSSAMPRASHREGQASPRRWRARTTARASIPRPPSNFSCSKFPPLSIRSSSANLCEYGGTRQRRREHRIFWESFLGGSRTPSRSRWVRSRSTRRAAWARGSCSRRRCVLGRRSCSWAATREGMGLAAWSRISSRPDKMTSAVCRIAARARRRGSLRAARVRLRLRQHHRESPMFIFIEAGLGSWLKFGGRAPGGAGASGGSGGGGDDGGSSSGAAAAATRHLQ